MQSVEETKKDQALKYNRAIIIIEKIGKFFLILALITFLVTFYPVITQELKYFFLTTNNDTVVLTEESSQNQKNRKVIVAKDKEFSLVIPRINANAKVIPNVDPYNSSVYQQALTKGVAHAEGAAYPGNIGNVFVFSHSSANFYEANRYNSVFFLLHKLKIGDTFYFVYEGDLFEYKVVETKVVKGENIEYLTDIPAKKQATLMTCWPPGTTLKRFVVIGELSSVNNK